MNLQRTIAEIGLMEIGRVVARFTERNEPSPFLPVMKPEEMERQIEKLALEIVGLNKKHLFMLTPEIALLESLADNNWDGLIIIAIPFDAEIESSDRIQANIPRGINVNFIREGEFPGDYFIPESSALLCGGFTVHGIQYKILPSSFRMMSLYKQFAGDRILVSAFPPEADIPELGWDNADSDFFTNRVGV